MTDDELSELAETLADACEEFPVQVSAKGICCPFGALIGCSGRPLPWLSEVIALVPYQVAHDFMTGFEGLNSCDDDRAYQLGRLFRELYP